MAENTNNSVPPVIDVEVLLQPISDDAPSGESQQYTGVYDEIKEARRADDTLSRGQWQQELKVADWRQVIDLSINALRTQTKDLQIACWMTEALLKQHGLAGLRDGLRLLHGLYEKFWDTLFPEIDEGDDMEARANAMEFLNRQASDGIKELPLTLVQGLNFFNYEESKLYDIPSDLDSLDYDVRQKYATLKQQAVEEKRITGEMWRVAKSQSNRAFYEEKNTLLNECWEAFVALDTIMDDKFGRQTPGLNALKKSISDVRDVVKKLVEEKRIEEPDPADLFVEEPTEGGDGNGAGMMVTGGSFAVGGGAIRTRQDALKRLSEISDFFRRTEPHSPVSFIVQKAVRWGNLSLDAWLQEVIKDATILGQLRETLGVEPKPPEEG
jgi:type VI secretion system protein ImpA